MLAVLRRRSFALLWVSSFVSVSGDWVLYAALPFFVYRRTGSTVATAGMIAAELGPGVVVGLLAGVWVDRLDRKRLLVVTNVLQAGTVASLVALQGGLRIWLVYVVAATQSVIASVSVPAERALLPSLVPADDLVAANALTALANRLARLLGVPLGGLLLATLGIEAVVLLDAASFLAAALLVALVTAPPRATSTSPAPSFRGEWLEGLLLVRQDRTVATAFWVLGLMTFGGTMLDPLYVAWVRDVLGRGPELYALLLTTHAVAGIAGSLLVGRLGSRLRPRFLMGWSSVVAGIALIVKWDVPQLVVAFSLTAVSGITSIAAAIGVDSWLQQSVDDRFRGRVFAALGASGALFSLLGAVAGGVAAQRVGVPAMLNVSALLIIGAGAVVLVSLHPRA